MRLMKRSVTNTNSLKFTSFHLLSRLVTNLFLCVYFRLVLDFDLFLYAFGQLSTVIWAWGLMFGYTLLGPYHVVRVWGGLYHSCQKRTRVTAGMALILCAAQLSMLGIFPVCVVLRYQLPPASRFIIILEQVYLYV